MPRKTSSWRNTRLAAAGFNEAAARCRGKRRLRGRWLRGWTAASMRPRPDAAENTLRFGRFFETTLASMRPRPDAAENVLDKLGCSVATLLQ